jgi:SAM-dependent methyltransferase
LKPYSLDKLKEYFRSEDNRPTYVDFLPSKGITDSLAISARESAIEKNLQLDDFEAMLRGQSLPPYKVLRQVLELLRSKRVLPPIEGVGIELGAGLALLSVALIQRDDQNLIEGIFALEAVKPFASKGIQRTSAEILGPQRFKIMPCYGVFEEILLADCTLDFACQIESLHHAEDLEIALKEVSRVLRPGAYLISIDRSWIDSVPTKVLDEMLDHEYSKQWLDAKKFNSESTFTRRDNGEHEYRDKDWKRAFERSGFTLVMEKHLHPDFKLWNAIKRLLGLLAISNLVGIKVKARPGTLRNFFAQNLGLRKSDYSNLIRSPHPRPLTVFVFQKD